MNAKGQMAKWDMKNKQGAKEMFLFVMMFVVSAQFPF